MIDVIADISHYQTVDDWWMVRESGIAAVVLKATQGKSYVDPMFVQRVGAAEQAGLLVGAYHFLDATNPTVQVEHFLSVAGHLTVLAFDIESNALSTGTVTIKQAAKAVSMFNGYTNRLPVIYMGRYGPDGRGTGLPNAILSRCDLWIAGYTTNPHPKLPAGWSNWKLWQYTSSGAVPGIKGGVDRSRWNGDEASLREYWEMDHA